MQQKRIHSPRHITYKRGVEYVDWRTTFKKRTGKIVGRNTAIFELKTLSLTIDDQAHVFLGEGRNRAVHALFSMVNYPIFPANATTSCTNSCTTRTNNF
jgi:16S rRNA U516 pseudouridylate synthase RsuA-like enzyme